MIKLTKESLRQIFPKAPQAVIDAFAAKQDLLTKAGINATRARLSYFLANIEHECGGFTIPNLTENINYTASRMAEVWPNRFSGAAAVQAKYGTSPGWQKKAFDDIYGSRMGNRPGTSDGSTYIGRGGPQWTGRDGYANLERLTGLPAVADPTVATKFELQPEVCAAFWTWKNLNRFADAGDFIGCVKAWNGGTNGLADRQHLMAGNDPVIARLETVNAIAPAVPAPKKPATATADVIKTGSGAVIAGTIATGAHQGWGPVQWAVAAACIALICVSAFFIVKSINRPAAA
jgi:putative chitinase